MVAPFLRFAETVTPGLSVPVPTPYPARVSPLMKLLDTAYFTNPSKVFAWLLYVLLFQRLP